MQKSWGLAAVGEIEEPSLNFLWLSGFHPFSSKAAWAAGYIFPPICCAATVAAVAA